MTVFTFSREELPLLSDKNITQIPPFEKLIVEILDINFFYDSRKPGPGSYRRLGIGIKSIKDAGPLARSVIKYLKDNIR